MTSASPCPVKKPLCSFMYFLNHIRAERAALEQHTPLWPSGHALPSIARAAWATLGPPQRAVYVGATDADRHRFNVLYKQHWLPSAGARAGAAPPRALTDPLRLPPMAADVVAAVAAAIAAHAAAAGPPPERAGGKRKAADGERAAGGRRTPRPGAPDTPAAGGGEHRSVLAPAAAAMVPLRSVFVSLPSEAALGGATPAPRTPRPSLDLPPTPAAPHPAGLDVASSRESFDAFDVDAALGRGWGLGPDFERRPSCEHQLALALAPSVDRAGWLPRWDSAALDGAAPPAPGGDALDCAAFAAANGRLRCGPV